MTEEAPRPRGPSLLGVLIVVAVVVLTLTFLRLITRRGENQAWAVKCTGNLKQIFAASQEFADAKNCFPRVGTGSDANAERALNVLLRSRFGRALPAEVFDCPAGEATTAERTPDERWLVLTPETNDYAWSERIAKPTRTTTLAADKWMGGWKGHMGHKDRVIVLFTDGSVEFAVGSDSEHFDAETGTAAGLTR